MTVNKNIVDYLSCCIANRVLQMPQVTWSFSLSQNHCSFQEQLIKKSTTRQNSPLFKSFCVEVSCSSIMLICWALVILGGDHIYQSWKPFGLPPCLAVFSLLKVCTSTEFSHPTSTFVTKLCPFILMWQCHSCDIWEVSQVQLSKTTTVTSAWNVIHLCQALPIFFIKETFQ